MPEDLQLRSILARNHKNVCGDFCLCWKICSLSEPTATVWAMSCSFEGFIDLDACPACFIGRHIARLTTVS